MMSTTTNQNQTDVNLNSKLQAHNTTIQSIMDEKDIFERVLAHKSLIIAGICGLVLAVILGAIYFQQREKNFKIHAGQVYQFSETAVKDYTEKKITADMYVSQFLTLKNSLGSFIGLAPLGIQVADQLTKDNQLASALKILNAIEGINTHEFMKYMIYSRKAVIFEDQNQYNESIDALLKLSGLSSKIFEAKTYMDLGRMYVKIGDKEKAKKSFEYVTSQHKDEAEFVKISKLYLGQL